MGVRILVLVCLLLLVDAGSDMSWLFGEYAYKRCKSYGKKIPRNACGKLQDMIDDTFDILARQLSETFNVSSRDADERMKRPAFKKVGYRIVDEMVDWIFASQSTERQPMYQQWQDKFFKWFMQVVEDKEPEPSPPMPSQEEIQRLIAQAQTQDVAKKLQKRAVKDW